MLEMNGCEKSVVIFAEINQLIPSIVLADPFSSSSPLCRVVNKAMLSFPIINFLNRPSTDVDRLCLFIGFNRNMCEGLACLLNGEDFMQTIGHAGNKKLDVGAKELPWPVKVIICTLASFTSMVG